METPYTLVDQARCGKGAGISRPRLPAPPSRWTVWAAHAVPLCVLPSGLWRLAAITSVSDGWYHAGELGMDKLYMLALSVVSEALALLTLGLVSPWGEVVSRWIPLVGGRRVPIPVAVIPAALGTLAIFGLYAFGPLNRYVFHLHFAPAIGSNSGILPDGGPALWALVACYAPLFGWGPLLAVVTVAYYRRRRNRT